MTVVRCTRDRDVAPVFFCHRIGIIFPEDLVAGAMSAGALLC